MGLQGHRTYPAFLHFLLCITLASTYIAVVCAFVLWHAFEDPLRMVSLFAACAAAHQPPFCNKQDELMPLHGIFLTFYALVFALVIGSFYCYHLYLV